MSVAGPVLVGGVLAESADTAALRRVAASVEVSAERLRGGLRAAGALLADLAPPAWDGAGRRQAEDAMRARVHEAAAAADVLRDAAAALTELAAQLRVAAVQREEARALAARFDVEIEGDRASAPQRLPMPAGDLGPARVFVADEVERLLSGSTRRASLADEDAAERLRRGLRVLSVAGSDYWLPVLAGGAVGRVLVAVGAVERRTWPQPQVLDGLRDVLAAPHPATAVAGDRAARVRAYVESLSTAQRALLLREHPVLVGGTDGMPATMRYAANRVLLQRAQVDARSRGDLRQAAVLAGLLADPGRQFLLVDVAGGRIAEVMGDLDGAAAISVVVPGVGTRMDSYEAGLAARARALAGEAATLPGGPVAVVAWLGYSPPPAYAAAWEDTAQSAGRELREFVAGLLPHDGVPVSVLAHSYGSLVTGVALRRGMRVSAVAALGSPGMGARRGAALLPPGQRVPRFYAARAPGDQIGLSENFGRDPADLRFGGVRLATGTRPDPVRGRAAVRGHSAYFAKSSTVLASLAGIAAGRCPPPSAVLVQPNERLVTSMSDLQELLGWGEEDVILLLAEWEHRKASGLEDWVGGHLSPAARRRIARYQAGRAAVLEGLARAEHFGDRMADVDLHHDIRFDDEYALRQDGWTPGLRR